MSESWRKELKDLIRVKDKLSNGGYAIKAAKYCEKIGFLLFENGFFDDAVAQFKEQAQIYLNAKNNIETARTYHILADLYCDCGETDKALNYAQKFYSLSHQEGNLIELQRATATIGRIYYLKATTVACITREDKKRKTQLMERSLELYNQSISISETLTSNVSKLELQEMRARLYLNISILLEEWGRYQEAETKYKLAAAISQDCLLSENEYKALKNLADLKYKQNEFDESLKYLEEARRCVNKIKDKSFLAEINLLSSRIRLAEGKFQEAVLLLKRSYDYVHLLIDSSLKDFNYTVKNAINALNASKQLVGVKSDKVRTLLLHTIGFILMKFRSYKLAINYFLPELSILKSNTTDTLELLVVYRLLAKCFYHAKDYKESLVYYNKALKISKANDKEALDNVIKIGKCQEELGLSYEKIKSTYINAIQLLAINPSTRYETILYNRIRRLRERFSHIDDITEWNLNSEVSRCSQSTSSTETLSEYNSEDESDFDVAEELSKIQDNGDILPSLDTANKAKRIKNKSRFDPNKKNELGETLLHVATIKGNVSRVKELIELGADVNLRDNCGWIPLHEACNHGHLDIVEILLDHGSFINDQGGINCDGITPLLDAAENMHLDVVKLMLNRGADPSIKDKNERSIFDILKNASDNKDLSSSQQQSIQDIMIIIKNSIIPSNKHTSNKISVLTRNTKIDCPSSSSRLTALSSERVPLIVAASKAIDLRDFHDNLLPPAQPALTTSTITKDSEWLIPDKNIEPEDYVNPTRRKKRAITLFSDEEVTPPNAKESDPVENEHRTVDANFVENTEFDLVIPDVQSFTDNNRHIYTETASSILPSCSKLLKFKVNMIKEEKVIACSVEQTTPLLGIQLYKSLANINQTFEAFSFDFILTDSNNSLLFPFINLNHIYCDNICVNCYTIKGNMTPSEIYRNVCNAIGIEPSCHILDYLNNNLNLDDVKMSSIMSNKLDIQLISFYYSLLLYKDLRMLDFSYCRIYESEHLKFISNILPFLKFKSLSFKNFDMNLKKLSNIFSFFTSMISDKFSKDAHLMNCVNDSLEYLDLSHNNLNGDPVEFSEIFYTIFKYGPKISRFDISYCCISDDIFHPDLTFVSFIHGNLNLIDINVSCNIFDNITIKHFFLNFIPWSNFNSIKLSDSTKSISQLPLHLSSFINLSDKSIFELDISGNNCCNTFSSIASLSMFHENISYLNISYTGICKYELEQFSQNATNMLNLHTLIMSGCTSVFSNLDNLFSMICTFSYCPCLRVLDMSHLLTDCDDISYSQLSPNIIQNKSRTCFNPKSHLSIINLHYNRIKEFELEKWKLWSAIPESYEFECSELFCRIIKRMKE